jgi:hypothetical protein
MPSSIHAGNTNAKSETASNRRAAIRDTALAALADTPADGKAVKATVLRELHRQHPVLALEDILELSVSVAIPEADIVRKSVDGVLDEALDQHDAWQTTESHSKSVGADIPATEER